MPGTCEGRVFAEGFRERKDQSRAGKDGETHTDADGVYQAAAAASVILTERLL